MPALYKDMMPGPPSPIAGQSIDGYYLAASSLPVSCSKADVILRSEIFSSIVSGGGRMAPGHVKDCKVSPAEVSRWLQAEVLRGNWPPIVMQCCSAVWQISKKPSTEVFSNHLYFLQPSDLRTLFVAVQRLTELYVRVGATSPTEQRFLSFSEFQNLTSLLCDWGFYVEDPYDSFREAGTSDAPGGSLLPLDNLTRFSLANCTKYISDTGVPEEAWIIIAPAAIVRKSHSLTSPQVGDEVPEGETAIVIDIVGRRALLSSPVNGWVSIKTRRGQDIMEPLNRERSTSWGSPNEQQQQWALQCNTRSESRSGQNERTHSSGSSLEPEPLPQNSIPVPSLQFDSTSSLDPMRQALSSPSVYSRDTNEAIIMQESFPPMPMSAPAPEPTPIREPNYGPAPAPLGSKPPTSLLAFRHSNSDSRSPPPSRSASGHMNFTKPTQNACMRIQDPSSGQADFKKYPWDFAGECVPLPSRTRKMSAGQTPELRFALGKPVQKLQVGSAAFKSSTPRGTKMVKGYSESGSLGPGAYAADSRQKKVHPRSRSQSAAFCTSKRDVLKTMTGGKVVSDGNRPVAREGRARETPFATNKPSFMQPLKRTPSELKMGDRKRSSSASTNVRKPGFGSSTRRELPLRRVCGPDSYQQM